MAEWISVKDRLPDKAGEYHVAFHPCHWDSECPLSEKYKPPRTWGDSIRAMSNEQMANQFAVWGICPEGKLGGKTRRCRHFGLCTECWKAFLEEVP